MRIKVRRLGDGLHPSEVAIQVDSADGPQELVVGRDALSQDSIDVGHPVARHDRFYLVELPVETTSGAWRVWIDKNNVQALEAAE